MEQDESGVAKSQHVVHVLPPGDARVAGILAPQVQRTDNEVEGVQLLVLVPSADTAAWLARLVNPTITTGGALLVPATAPARAARRVSAGARVLAATPSDALSLVRGSSLKLDAVSTVVFIDGSALLAEHGEAVATLLAELPRDAERLMVTSDIDETVAAFLEAHMRRARRITHDILPTSGSSLQYVVVSRSDRAVALRRVLDHFDPARATVLAAEDFAPAAARALAAIGYAVDDTLVRLRVGAVDAHEPLVVCFGAPQSASELQAITASTPKTTVALVAPEELSAFLRLTGGRATPLALSAAPAAARAAEEVLRDELRAVLRARALHRETLAIEPLLADHDAVEVAAAALRMLEVERERARGKRPVRSPEPPAVAAPSERIAPVGTTYTKLFINVGERDGAKKGDFVGAITGEAGLTADQIGKLEVRDSHTIAEVSAEHAEKVIAALNGSTIRGRHVLAREDRGPTEREGGERGGFRSDRGAERGERGGERGSFRGGERGGSRGGDRDGERGGFRGRSGGGFRSGARSGFAAGDRDRGAERGARTGDAHGDAGRGERASGGERGGERGGFRGGARDRGGFKGGPSRGAFRGGDRDRGGFRSGPPRDRGPRRDDGAPARRPFDRTESSGPRAIQESREWSERGDRLRHARGRRSED